MRLRLRLLSCSRQAKAVEKCPFGTTTRKRLKDDALLCSAGAEESSGWLVGQPLAKKVKRSACRCALRLFPETRAAKTAVAVDTSITLLLLKLFCRNVVEDAASGVWCESWM